MGEAKRLPVDLEDAGRERLCQAVVEPSTDDAFHDRHRRLDGGGHRLCDVEAGRGEPGETLLQQLVEVGRDRQALARSEYAALRLERVAELEREERVAAGRL